MLRQNNAVFDYRLSPGSASELIDFRVMAVKATGNVSFGEEVIVTCGTEYSFPAFSQLLRVQKSVVTHTNPFFLI